MLQTPKCNFLFRSIQSVTFLLVGCADPWAGIPTNTDSTSNSGGSTGGTIPGATADLTTTAPTTSTITETTSNGVTVGETTGSGTTENGTTSGGTTRSETTGGDTSTGGTTVGETTESGTTGGNSSTGGTTVEETTESGTAGGGTSTGSEEQCPPFVPTQDLRFEALLEDMQLEAVSPSLDDVGGTLPSGRAVAIVVDGELRHVSGVGTRAKEGHALAAEPVGPETRFWTASTSKWIHGAMMASLVEDGLLDFDTLVTDVLPEYTETNGLHGTITLHRLLTMTSGLGRGDGCLLMSVSASEKPLGCAAFSDGPGTVLERLFDPMTLANAPYNSNNFNNTINGAPGTYKYSNWGIMLSGRMAEVTGGAPYPDLVAARIFAPAHMCTATYDPAEVIASGDYAVGGGIIEGACPEPELGHDSKAPWEPDELACRARDPNGGVRASALDMGRFAAAFLADLKGAHIMIDQGLADRMLCPGGGTHAQGCTGRVAIDAPTHTYGYTNIGYTWQGLDIYSHPGGRPGFSSLLMLVPARDFAVAILSNQNSDTDGEWGGKIVDCWLNDIC